jgi:phosphoserine phosphatase
MDGTLTWLNTFVVWFGLLIVFHPLRSFRIFIQQLNKNTQIRIPKRIALAVEEQLQPTAINQLQRKMSLISLVVFRTNTRSFVREMRDSGFSVVVISNSSRVSLQPLASSLKADLIATHNQEDGGIVQVNGIQKAFFLKDWIMKNNYLNPYIIGIGDSSGDLEMLNMCDRAFMVRGAFQRQSRTIPKTAIHKIRFNQIVQLIRKEYAGTS